MAKAIVMLRDAAVGAAHLAAGVLYSVADQDADFLIAHGAARLNAQPVVPGNSQDAGASQPLASAASNVASWQTAAERGGLIHISTVGQHAINDPILCGGDTEIVLAEGVEIASTAAFRHTLFRTGNADFTGDAPARANISIICASHGTTAGIGQLRELAAPARLAWRAPGDSEGPTVDVSGADGRYELSSANGSKLYVTVIRTGMLGAGVTPVKVANVTGAVPVTWARASNVTTVTERGHGRRVGDAIILFGTNFVGQAFIETATTDTYTFTDSRSNNSGAGAVYGVRNFSIRGPGKLNYGAAISISGRNTSQLHAVVLLGVSKVAVDRGLELNDLQKYGVYAQCVHDLVVDIKSYSDTVGSSSAGFQSTGKIRKAKISVTGKATDTLTAASNGDYPTQTFLFPTDEGGLDSIDLEFDGIRGSNSKFELVRLIGATGQWFRNVAIRNVRGAVDASTGSCISTYADPAMLSAGECNMDGLSISDVAVSKIGTTQCSVVLLRAAGATNSRGINIENIGLLFPGEANGDGMIILDSGNFEDVTVRKVFTRNTFQGQGVLTRNSVSIQKLTVEDINLVVDNALRNTTWASSCLFVGGTPTIKTLITRGLTLREVSAGGTKSDTVRILHTGGALSRALLYDTNINGGVSAILFQATDTACRIVALGIGIEGTTFATRLNSAPAELSIGGCAFSVTPTDLVRIGYSSATVKIRSLGGIMCPTPSSGKHVNIAAGTANSPDVNGADLLVDIAALAAVRGNLVRDSANGDVKMYNGTAWAAVA
jgi:hypothetical protein